MDIIQQGTGPALVLVPGIQGRWEYLRPAVNALARRFRVITFPLCGERSCRRQFDPALGFDNYVAQIGGVLDDVGVDRAVVCGVSFGGLVSLRFAAAFPKRAAALVLASTPGPQFQLRPRHHLYARVPWLFGPLFLLESPLRMRREIAAVFPSVAERVRFGLWQLETLVEAPLSVTRMARRARLISPIDLIETSRRISAPTLVVTGEPGLDYVVPADRSSEYARLIPGARHATIERTGHLGTITRPDEFARLVFEFATSVRATGHAA